MAQGRPLHRSPTAPSGYVDGAAVRGWAGQAGCCFRALKLHGTNHCIRPALRLCIWGKGEVSRRSMAPGACLLPVAYLPLRQPSNICPKGPRINFNNFTFSC